MPNADSDSNLRAPSACSLDARPYYFCSHIVKIKCEMIDTNDLTAARFSRP